ncbi:MAG TPA: response regulator [Planctomycetota bacterium]|nr:response regulator [Planctomycetota bacterium]
MNELKTWYRDRLPARIAALEAARADLARPGTEALGSIRRIAHLLRGSGGTYGFPEITECARRVEEAPDEALREPLVSLIETLRSAAGAPRDERASVLIVDDDVELAGFMKTLLSTPGREILTAHSGAEALAILETREVSLIVLDLILPDADGRNLLLKIRERVATATTPVIVITFRSADQARIECIALGADGFLEKPISPDALLKSVDAMIAAGTDGAREQRLDPLTGLPNRAAFLESFGRARSTGASLNLALIDIDHFDLIRELGDRKTSDEVLRRVAGVLSRTLPSSCQVARWGAAEFAVLLLDQDVAAASAALNDTLFALKSETVATSQGQTLQITFSAGVVPVPPDATSEEAIADADRHLYLAKQGGQERVVSPADKIDAPRKRILLAEDDEMICLVVRRLLEREGYEVTTCTDGSSALRSAYENSYAVILSDIRMPQLDGFEFLRRLRDQEGAESTPVILLTSMGRDEDLHRGFELGADDYIVKPFSASELLTRVRRLLKKTS